jgi:GTP-binding protein Era
MQLPPATRCGTIVLAGRPNVGKSTLLNALVGTDLAITSPKPQSTRQPVVGIRTEGSVQLVVIDPPGLLEPHYLLQRTMVDEAVEVVRQADAVLHLERADETPGPPLASLLPSGAVGPRPVATVVTAIDLVEQPHRPRSEGPTFYVNARAGDGLGDLVSWCAAHVPVAPFRYDPDDVSSQPVRFFVEEFVREAAFDLLQQEIPYSVAARVDEFREGSNPLYIRVTVFVERASQKGMVVGDGGRTIKRLGAAARQRIESLLGQQVYLDLWVKVLPRWRKSPELLRRLGFRVPTVRSP